MTRKDFRAQANKVIILARAAVSFTKTEKDDEVVELFAHLIEDDEHFAVICDLAEIPADAPPAA